MTKLILAVALIVVALPLVNCGEGSKMSPLPPFYSARKPSDVPLIIAAQVLEDCHPVESIQRSRWDGRPFQLWKVRVNVEQVLKGELSTKRLDIFYFANMAPGSFSYAHSFDLYKSRSEVFFLQRDGNHWRAICDFGHQCIIWVRTGSHYKLSLGSSLSIEDSIMRLLLSRGDSTTDRQMLDAMSHPVGTWGWKLPYDHLQRISTSDSSDAVRAFAKNKHEEFEKSYNLSPIIQE